METKDHDGGDAKAFGREEKARKGTPKEPAPAAGAAAGVVANAAGTVSTAPSGVRRVMNLFRSGSKPAPAVTTAAPVAAPGSSAPIFGASLEDQVDVDTSQVPRIIRMCVEQVELRGMDSLGIYRYDGWPALPAAVAVAAVRVVVTRRPCRASGAAHTRRSISGNSMAIQSLKEMIARDIDSVNLGDLSQWDDINCVTGLLKLYLRELPDPVIPYAFYNAFVQADHIRDYNARLFAIKDHVFELPRINFAVLNFLCRHLKRVTEHEAANKMASNNLAIVFGPTLMRSRTEGALTMLKDMSHQCSIVESMISLCEWVFTPDAVEQRGKAMSEPEPEAARPAAATSTSPRMSPHSVSSVASGDFDEPESSAFLGPGTAQAPANGDAHAADAEPSLLPLQQHTQHAPAADADAPAALSEPCGSADGPQPAVPVVQDADGASTATPLPPGAEPVSTGCDAEHAPTDTATPPAEPPQHDTVDIGLAMESSVPSLHWTTLWAAVADSSVPETEL